MDIQLKLTKLTLGVAIMACLSIFLNLYTYFHFRDLDRGNREVWEEQIINNELQTEAIKGLTTLLKVDNLK